MIHDSRYRSKYYTEWQNDMNKNLMKPHIYKPRVSRFWGVIGFGFRGLSYRGAAEEFTRKLNDKLVKEMGDI